MGFFMTKAFRCSFGLTSIYSIYYKSVYMYYMVCENTAPVNVHVKPQKAEGRDCHLKYVLL